MKKAISTAVFLSFLVGIYILVSPSAFGQEIQEEESSSAVSSTLRNLIEEKSEALQELEEQRKLLQENLDDISTSENQISSEIRRTQNSINQLNLIVRANSIAVEKLDLEIQSLSGGINEVEQLIENRKDAIARLFGELQQRENESILSIFLRSQSLAESVSAAETLAKLNADLGVNLEELRKLRGDLHQKIREEAGKRSDKIQEQENLKYRKLILQDQEERKATLLSQTRSEGEVYERKIEELREVQLAISEEIEKFEEQLRQDIDPDLLPIPRPGVLEWPVPEGRMTQGYGATEFALRTYKGKFHNAIDIGKYLGAEIMTAEDGIVISSGNQDLYCPGGAYGKFVVVKHNNGLTTLYAHLSRYIVSVGQEVKRGEVIGYMGETGWAYGPHLHFTVFATNTLPPAKPGFPEGTTASNTCGPMPVGGHLDPTQYF